MTAPQIQMAHPLRWPIERPRTIKPKASLFRSDGRPLSLTTARRRLNEATSAATRPGQACRFTDMQLSTNIRFTAAGTRDQNVSRRDPDDVGVAFYFRLDRKPHVLACDRWDTVQDNIAAIAAHIEALRGQERWGCADLAQAFAGHVALPAPEQWWQVLGVSSSADVAAIDAAWRAKIREVHSDITGGSDAAAARLNVARDQGRAASA